MKECYIIKIGLQIDEKKGFPQIAFFNESEMN